MIYGIDYERQNAGCEDNELPICECCLKPTTHLVPCAWDSTMQVGPCCTLPEDADQAETGCTPFELTSPTEMPRLGPITARVRLPKTEVA